HRAGWRNAGVPGTATAAAHRVRRGADLRSQKARSRGPGLPRGSSAPLPDLSADGWRRFEATPSRPRLVTTDGQRTPPHGDRRGAQSAHLTIVPGQGSYPGSYPADGHEPAEAADQRKPLDDTGEPAVPDGQQPDRHHGQQWHGEYGRPAGDRPYHRI